MLARRIGCVIGVLFLCFLIYTPSFQSPFQLDDYSSIVENPAIKNIQMTHRIWHEDPSRFLTNVSFALNYYYGALDVVGYHWVNFGIHILTGAVFYLLIYQLLVLVGGASIQSGWCAVMATLLFLNHPIQTSAVTYIVQRGTLLTVLFYLLSVVLYLQYRIKKSFIFYGVALVSTILGVFCKPIIITLPLILILCEVYFFGNCPNRVRRFWAVLPFIGIVLSVPILLTLWKYKTFALQNVLHMTRETQSISRWEYLLTQINVVRTYVRLLFIPVGQNIDYQYPIARSLFRFPTGLSFGFLAVLFAASVKLYKKHKLISFGIMWFFVTLSLESTIFPISDVIFEHRLYLPMLGFALIVPVVLQGVIQNTKINRMVGIGIIVVFAFLTYQRNVVWSSRVGFLEDVARKSPNKIRVLVNLGRAYSSIQKYDLALVQYNKALALNPNDFDAHMNRASVYANQNQYDLAKEDYEKVLSLDSNNTKVHSNLGVLYEWQGKLDAALEEYKKATRVGKPFPALHFNRGNIYRVRKQYDLALNEYNKALRLDTRYAEVYNNRGLIYEIQGQYDEALKDFHKAAWYKSDYFDAFLNQGNIYARKRMWNKALSVYNKASVINPQSKAIKHNRLLVYKLMKE